MPDLSRQSDDICEEFSNSWTSTSSGVGGVADFMERSSSQLRSDHSLLLRLIQLDLEKTWCNWQASAEKQVSQGVSADELIGRWKLLPYFQNYAALFERPEEAGQYWSQLANIESQCRDRWGDGIGPIFYRHYFQVTTTEFPRRPRRHLRCEFDNNEDYSQVLFPLRGRNEIGRQRTRDLEAYFHEPQPDGNRIVVANRYEAEVSREQLTLHMLAPTVAVIINRSTVNSIQLTPNTVLAPGDKTCTLFPFILQIPGRRLICY